jgi:type IV fimbrial biogenesis protein FimT
MTSLTLARSEAIKRNLRVALCKSADGALCTTAGDWAQGWLVFVDRDSDGTFDAGEDVLRTQAALPGEFTLNNSNARDWYAYRPDGSAASSGGLVTGTFRVCPPTGDSSRARRVVTNITGRPQVRLGIGTLSCP